MTVINCWAVKMTTENKELCDLTNVVLQVGGDKLNQVSLNKLTFNKN